MIKGNPKFDGVTIGEFTAIFMGPTLDFKAKAAFVNSKTGQTHGWTTNQTWSPPVVAKLQELRALMEADLGAVHFEGGGEQHEAPTQRHDVRPPTGLGEHVGEGGIEQV
jgi:hypothetical protein